MKKQLSLLLLIFMTVGLSTASAAPITHTTQATTTYSKGHMTCYWVPIKIINLHQPPSIGCWEMWIKQHYLPPIYRTTSNKQNIVTIWKKVCSTSKPIPTPYKT